MKITMISQLTRKENTLDIPVTQNQLDAWKNGELIQNAMPNIPAEQREFLMTGVTPEEWKEYFGEGREIDDDDLYDIIEENYG